MRILQVVDTLRFGGAQKLMVTFAEQASARGIEAVVASLSSAEAMPLAPQIEAAGASVVSFPSSRLFDLKRFAAFYRYVRAGQFTVIHSHLTYANILSGLAGWLSGVPVISSLHSTGQDARHANFIRDNAELELLKRSARVLAVGENVQQAYANLGRPVDVLLNAVGKAIDLTSSERMELRKAITGDPSRPILVSVGRLSPDKCFDDLLRGFALLHKRAPEVALVVAGDGVLRSELVAQTEALGLSGHVFWLGMREDIKSLLAASDIYVNVSKREGLPLALLEAMMAGLPMVVTPVGDVPKLVSDDAGILVRLHGPEEFASAVSKLLMNDDLRQRFGKGARARAVQEYGAEQWFDRLLQFYTEANR